MEQGLNSVLRLSGSFVRPRYPGLRVKNRLKARFRRIWLPSKIINLLLLPKLLVPVSVVNAFSYNKVEICPEIVDTTSTDVRLNSSRQHHTPELAIPFNIIVKDSVFTFCEQLKIINE